MFAYAGVKVDPAYARLYPEQGPTSRMFANFHQRLNELFAFMNAKAKSNRHFNAEESRNLIALIEEIEDAQKILKRVGVNFMIGDGYRRVIEACRAFLSESYGSTIPDDVGRVDIAKYEPVFLLPDMEIQLPGRWKNVKLKMVGEGAFAMPIGTPIRSMAQNSRSSGLSAASTRRI
jgi:eukaryotic-like serine/threonine-protein kinase